MIAFKIIHYKLTTLCYIDLTGDLKEVVWQPMWLLILMQNVSILVLNQLTLNVSLLLFFFHENKSLTIGNIYRPPSAPSDSINCILATIHSLEKCTEQIILGDFNSNWLSHSSKNVRHLFNGANFTQLITEPTRVNLRSSSLLDWILLSNPKRIIKSGVMSDCFSDHCFIYCDWKIKTPRFPLKYIKFRQCKKINFDLFINDVININ